jgi:hypothetical protein
MSQRSPGSFPMTRHSDFTNGYENSHRVCISEDRTFPVSCWLKSYFYDASSRHDAPSDYPCGVIDLLREPSSDRTQVAIDRCARTRPMSKPQEYMRKIFEYIGTGIGLLSHHYLRLYGYYFYTGDLINEIDQIFACKRLFSRAIFAAGPMGAGTYRGLLVPGIAQ